ncbi:MAG: FAD-dependent oxidoreductase, partial [Longimicrobiales bacterium]
LDAWQELQLGAGRTLLRRTGGLTIGPASGSAAAAALRSASTHGVPVEVLARADLMARFPEFCCGADDIAIWEPGAGVLAVERCVDALLNAAHAAGAALRPGEPVFGWSTSDTAVELTTSRGHVRAARVVLAAGPWLGPLLGDIAPPLTVERNLSVWFEPSPGLDPARLPAFIHDAGDRIWYGVPEPGALKAGLHHTGEVRSIDGLGADIDARDIAAVRSRVDALIPKWVGRLRDARVCPYTNTPDHHFLIDRVPGEERVIVVSACSGHGFKFAPVVAELTRDLLLEEAAPPAAFRWRW